MELNKYNNLLELFNFQFNQQDPNNIFLKSLKTPDNIFTWQKTLDCIQKLSDELGKYLKKNDRCLLISDNRPEWLISDLAIMTTKGVTVPAYTTYTERDYEYLINDCKPSVIIVSDQFQYDKIDLLIKKNNFIKIVITFEDIKSDYKKIINIKKIFENEVYKKKDLINLGLERKDLACIIYTSGTTGNPKGVMLSHGGILSNCEGALEILKTILKDLNKYIPVFLTWLPLSHSYEHTVQFVQISLGAKVYYAESLEKLLSNMSISKPTIMTAVPRFYQNLYTKISSNFSKQKGFKKKLINNTILLGTKILKKEPLNFKQKCINFFCEKLVRKKIKKQFGVNLRAFVSGGGALDQKIGEFLNSIGLPTLQGYGLTEASPVVSCNIPQNIKIETVGPPFKSNTVKIADDGEILVKGENVMLGYWNMKKETEDIIKDGWLHTGDIGEITKEGNLKITDRKKEIIVNLGGDNISPSKIENLLCLSEKIKQSFVYGDKKTYLVALVVSEDDKNKKEIEFYIENLNKSLSLIEKVKKFQLIKEEFTIENGMLTPTLKLKRKQILLKYKNDLEKLY